MIKGILCKMFNLVPKAELELITKELDKLKEEHAALSKENTALVERNLLLENKVKDLEEENAILKTEITLLKDKVYALNELNTTLEKDKKALALNLSNSETKIATLTKENNKLLENYSTALTQIKNLEFDNNKYQSQIKEYQIICEKYREKIKNAGSGKNTEIEKLSQANYILQDKIYALQGLNTTLEKDKKALALNLSNSETKIATLTKENNKLIQSSATALEQIKELESNLLSLQKNTANMQKDAANMQSTIYVLQKENTALENEKKDLKQKLSDTDTKIATLTRENNKLIQSSTTALEQIKAQELKNDAFKLQVKNLQTLNDKYSRKINEYSEKEKQQTKEHTESLETLKTEHAKTIDTLQSEIHKYQKELNEKTAIIGEYELTLSKRNKEIKDVREENNKFKKKLKEQKSSLSSFNVSNVSETSSIDINNVQTTSDEDDSKLSSYRFREICKVISYRSNTNIVSVSDKLINEFYLSSYHKNFLLFITTVINNSPAFQKDDSIQGVCLHSIIHDINKELSDDVIIKNAIARIEKVKARIQNNLKYTNNNETENSDTEKEDFIEEESVDLNKIPINKSEVEIIKTFSDICSSISGMYMLNPQLKSINKVANKSIKLYSEGKEKISFITFISCRSLDKKIPSSIKNTHIKILELIKKDISKSDIINILQKDKSIFPYQRLNTINTNNRGNHNGTRYIIRYPSTIHSKSEIEIQNNNRIIISNGILYLNRVSKKTRIKSRFLSSIEYTTDNIYITNYLSKHGLIYLHRECAHIIYGTDLKNITYDSIGQIFEIQLSEKKKKTLSVTKILESIQNSMPH